MSEIIQNSDITFVPMQPQADPPKPDRIQVPRPPLPRLHRVSLSELQREMGYTDFQFGSFKSIVRDSARDLGLNIRKPHTAQEKEKWDDLVRLVVERQQKLNDFVDHWPIEVYFDSWTRHHSYHRPRSSRKRTSAIPEYLKLPAIPVRRYVGRRPPPLRSIMRSSTNRGFNPVDVKTSEQPEGTYDATVIRQPCLVCEETPAQSSQRFGEFLQKACVNKDEFVNLGIRNDLDLDTLALLGSDEVKELVEMTELSSYEQASFNNALRKFERRYHLKQGMTEPEINRYLTEIYTCKEHHDLHKHQSIPPLLLTRFNELHIEHLIPIALLLGINTDERFESLNSEFDDTAVGEMIHNQHSKLALSPFQQVVLQWALDGRYH
ncbi:hypothetical protein EV360DRAFT_77941 [Lentinula raphanica]|nr:hypothetical protein EV360DRAFT_77941 [Lentinula raphanica]